MAFVRNEMKSLIDDLNEYSEHRVWRTKQAILCDDGTFEKGTAVLIGHVSPGFRKGQIHMLLTELNPDEPAHFHGVSVDEQKFHDIFEVDQVLSGFYDAVEDASYLWEDKRGTCKAMGFGGFSYAFVVFLIMSHIVRPIGIVLLAFFLTIGIAGTVMYAVSEKRYKDSIREIKEQIELTL